MASYRVFYDFLKILANIIGYNVQDRLPLPVGGNLKTSHGIFFGRLTMSFKAISQPFNLSTQTIGSDDDDRLCTVSYRSCTPLIPPYGDITRKKILCISVLFVFLASFISI